MRSLLACAIASLATEASAQIITKFPFPPAFPSSSSSITTGPDGNLWFTDFDSSNGGVWSLTTAGVFTEFPLPFSVAGTVTAGPDGALGFTDNPVQIGRLTTAGVLSFFPTSPLTSPKFVTTRPDGALWFTQFFLGGNQIGRTTTAGAVTSFTIPTPTANAQGITAGPDGALWFAEKTGIGRMIFLIRRG